MTGPTDKIITPIRSWHRDRRFAMKLQQKIDRALESFVRLNATAWSPDLDEDDRLAINREVKRLIVAARKGDGAPRIIRMVKAADRSREPADEIRESSENDMRDKARELPVWAWVEGVRGAGDLGLATIIAETGNLSNYKNPAKVWKRLGFAPYDGLAGSSWKRKSWRPRVLTDDEWIANPFSGERYALMHQIAVWLVNAQWIGAAKTGEEEGKPNGYYGEVYAARRKHTAGTHPDWSKMHSRMDALRYTFKRFLRELWQAWRDAEKLAGQSSIDDHLAVARQADEAIPGGKPKELLPRRKRRARTGQGSVATQKAVAGAVRRKPRTRPDAGIEQ